jgi:hypothetical protein
MSKQTGNVVIYNHSFLLGIEINIRVVKEFVGKFTPPPAVNFSRDLLRGVYPSSQGLQEI